MHIKISFGRLEKYSHRLYAKKGSTRTNVTAFSFCWLLRHFAHTHTHTSTHTWNIHCRSDLFYWEYAILVLILTYLIRVDEDASSEYTHAWPFWRQCRQLDEYFRCAVSAIESAATFPIRKATRTAPWLDSYEFIQFDPNRIWLYCGEEENLDDFCSERSNTTQTLPYLRKKSPSTYDNNCKIFYAKGIFNKFMIIICANPAWKWEQFVNFDYAQEKEMKSIFHQPISNSILIFHWWLYFAG